MNAREARFTVIEAAKYFGRFDPTMYGEKNRKALMAQAQKLVAEGKMRWEVLDNGHTVFTLE